MNKKNGFTLIELLLVVALLSISFGVTSDILVTLTRSFNKTTVINEIEQQAGVVAQMIEKEVKNAAMVTNPAGDTSILQLEDTLNNTVYYRFLSVGGVGTLFRIYPLSADLSTQLNTVAKQRAYSITVNPTLHGLPTASPPEPVVGAVNVTCPDGWCFRVVAGRPSVVQVHLRFSQAQAGAQTSFTGRVEINNTIVVRNTY